MLKFEEVKKGSKIICVDDVTIWGRLTLGKEYIVNSIHPTKQREDQEWFEVQSDKGYWWYYPRHFVLAEDYKPEESDVWTTP